MNTATTVHPETLAVASPELAAAYVMASAEECGVSQMILSKVAVEGAAFKALLDAVANGCNTPDPALSEAFCAVELVRNLTQAIRTQLEEYFHTEEQ